ncbi:MAG: DUF6020 family protein [Candidatus Ventricola sp.]
MKSRDSVRHAAVIAVGAGMYALCFALGRTMETQGTCAGAWRLFLPALPVFALLLALLLRTGCIRARGKAKPFSAKRTFALLLLVYFGFYLIVFPGNFTYDTFHQLHQIKYSEYSMHHPLLHTLLLRLCFLPYRFLDSFEVPAALYAVTQMLLLAGLLTAACASIRRSCGDGAARTSAWFFALYPLHACFASHMTKDVLFGGAFALMLALAVEITAQPACSRRQAVLLTLASALALMLRNNMLYAVAVWFALLLPGLRRKQVRHLALCTLAALVLSTGGQAILKTALHAENGDFGEMLSVPIQQVSRVSVKAYDALSPEEIALLDEAFMYHAYLNYTPYISDAVKDGLQSEAIRENPCAYLQLYESLGKRYPQEYLDAFVALISPYLYPYSHYHFDRDYVEMGIHPNAFEWTYGVTLEQNTVFAPVREWLNEHIFKTGADEIPILNFIMNLGVISWAMLFLVMREAYRGDWLRFAIGLLPVLLFGTYLLGPVMQGRYIYPFVCSLPVLASHVQTTKALETAAKRERGSEAASPGRSGRQPGVTLK